MWRERCRVCRRGTVGCGDDTLQRHTKVGGINRNRLSIDGQLVFRVVHLRVSPAHRRERRLGAQRFEIGAAVADRACGELSPGAPVLLSVL